MTEKEPSSDSNGNNSQRKGTTISIRIEGTDVDLIDSSADYYHMSRSELIRQAAKNYIRLSLVNEERPNPKLFFSHNMLSILFRDATESTIRDVAKMSYVNGQNDFKFFQKIRGYNIMPEDFSPTQKIDSLGSVVRNVFSDRGQNWFEKVLFTRKNDLVMFSGRHDMGKNFSLFIKYLLQHHLDEINFVLVKEEMNDRQSTKNPEITHSMVRLSFRPKDAEK